jgi:hypothetical protein
MQKQIEAETPRLDGLIQLDDAGTLFYVAMRRWVGEKVIDAARKVYAPHYTTGWADWYEHGGELP